MAAKEDLKNEGLRFAHFDVFEQSVTSDGMVTGIGTIHALDPESARDWLEQARQIPGFHIQEIDPGMDRGSTRVFGPAGINWDRATSKWLPKGPKPNWKDDGLTLN